MEQTRTRRKEDKGVGSRQLGGRTRAWDDHAANVAGCNEAQIMHATRPEPSGFQVRSEGRRRNDDRPGLETAHGTFSGGAGDYSRRIQSEN